VRITDSTELDHPQTILEHHLRIKIFDERGRDEHAKVDITYDDDARVRDVEGRTIAPNGSIAELRGQDVFDRTIVETNGIKLKAKSFALPAVVPGAIIDYRWREIRDNAVANYLELPFQRDIPTHHVRYELKALSVRELGYRMRVSTFNFQTPPDTGKADMGYTFFEMRDVAARRREALMPPVLSVTPWMLIYYADLAEADRPPAQFWQRFGRSTFDALKAEIRITNPIRTSATEATRGATTVDDKVNGLLRFVRAHVKRDDLGDTVSDRRANKDAAETLSKRVGDGHEVTALFAALATAAGLDVRLALLPDRTEYISHPDMKQPYFLDRLAVAVKSGEGWRFVDPANHYAAGAHLAWWHEGQYALLLHENAPQVVVVPVAAPDLSVTRRSGSLTIAGDGTLSGNMTLEYSGHAAWPQREHDSQQTAAERERLFKERLERDYTGAEVSGFAIENLEELDQPYRIRFTLRVPGYAQRAGGRLLLQPGLFHSEREARFTAATRVHQLHFPYALREEDSVTFTLPDGFTADLAGATTRIGLDGGATAAYSRTLTPGTAPGTFVYTRALMTGGQGRVMFPREVYMGLKSFYDTVHEGDRWTLSARAAATPAQ
jgi:hypothetical protein